MRTSLILSSDVWLLICTLHTLRSKLSVRHEIKQDSSSVVLFFRKKTMFENNMYSPSKPRMPTDAIHDAPEKGKTWHSAEQRDILPI